MVKQKSREDYAKRSLDAFFAYYEREPYRRRIQAMGKLGISTAALDVVLNPETYVYVPTGEGASPEMPFEGVSSHIGVVIANPGEQVELTVDVHPLQRPSDLPPLRDTTSPPVGAGGSTYSRFEKRTSGDLRNTHYLYRRPTLFLPYDDEPGAQAYSTVIAHELTHVAQLLTCAERVFENSENGELDRMVSDYNNEFDAYQMQEDVFSGDIWNFILDATGGTAISVVSYRKRYLASTGGYVTRENLDAVRRSRSVGPAVSYAFIPEDN